MTDDVKGKVTSYVDYDEWGKSTGKAVLKLGLRQLDLVKEYTGYTYDSVLNVYYAKARMYDPNNRRFLAVDPIKGTVANPQSMVQYSYVLGNPLKYTDSTGMRPDGDNSDSYGLDEGAGGSAKSPTSSKSTTSTTSPTSPTPDKTPKKDNPTNSTPLDLALGKAGKDSGANVTMDGDVITVNFGGFEKDYNAGDYDIKDGKVQFPDYEITAFVDLANRINGWGDDPLVLTSIADGINETYYSKNGTKPISMDITSETIKRTQQEIFDSLIDGVRNTYRNDTLPDGPEKGYKTMDEAATAWSLLVAPQSFENRWEYASAIYYEDGYYKFTEPYTDKSIMEVKPQEAPDGKILVAMIHSHVYVSVLMGEEFSGLSGDIGTARHYEVPIYLTTPSGVLKKFNPNKWLFQESVISNDMPVDPKSPK